MGIKKIDFHVPAVYHVLDKLGAGLAELRLTDFSLWPLEVLQHKYKNKPLGNTRSVS